jgi:hypothetical protein
MELKASHASPSQYFYLLSFRTYNFFIIRGKDISLLIFLSCGAEKSGGLNTTSTLSKLLSFPALPQLPKFVMAHRLRELKEPTQQI